MGLFKKKKPEFQTLEVSEKNIGLRTVAVVLFLLIGLSCIAYFFYSILSKDPGWNTIETDHVQIKNELIFNYDLGSSGMSATEEYNRISAIYSREALKAYRLFDIYSAYNGVVNLYYINANPNTSLEVDPILYRAFELMQNSGNRMMYLAPINAEYRNLFFSQNEVEARTYDPYFNEESADYMDLVVRYTNDPSMIDLRLLGENKVSLFISEDYMNFIEYYGITEFIDFSWLTNAFIVDYVADIMIENGYTKGNISSYDGFIRNLDNSGEKYSFNIFDRVGNNVYPAATSTYQFSTSIVFMRNYPMSTQDERVFYGYPDGNCVSRYADAATGRYKSALNNMVSYSSVHSCAEVALMMSKFFIADDFDAVGLNALRDSGIYSVWTKDKTVNYNDEKITVGDLYSSEEISYESVLIN